MRAYTLIFIRIALLNLLLALPGTNVYCADHTTVLWQKANNYYQQKQYDSAVSYYQKIAATGQVSTELFYNTGNAYYRLNKIGPAILYYEKALRQNPGYKPAADNLLLAKNRVDNPVTEVTPVFFERWWYNLLHTLNANSWAGLLLLLFCITIFLVYLSTGRKLRYPGRWIAFSATLLLVTGAITFFSYRDTIDSGRAVVIDADISLLDAPKPGAKISSNVPEGTTVVLGHQNGIYTQVELPNGRRGWIASNAIEKI